MKPWRRSRDGRSAAAGGTGLTLMLSTNAAWNVANFRMGLIAGLRAAGHEVVVAARPDGYESVIAAAGVRFVPIAMDPYGRSPLAAVALTFRFLAAMRAERPDAFLGYTIKPNICGSVAARLSGVRRINNIAGLGTMFARRGWTARIVRMLYRAALAGAHHVFFQNDDDLRMFTRSRVVDPAIAERLPGSGVDTRHFAPDPAAPPGEGFLLVGRLLREKGVEDFVRAARLVREQVPDARFRLLGFVDERHPNTIARAQIAAWEDEGIIAYLGTAGDVRAALAAAACVVLPSYYREGTPRSLIEAAAMGLPVITTDMPGCRDVVDDGITGIVVPARDDAALADAMLRIIAMSPAARAAMGAAARAKAIRQFDEALVIERYLAALEAIPRTRGHAARFVIDQN